MVEITDDMASIIDKLVLCKIHTDEPIKFFCKQCTQQLCITCQVISHRSHDIATVQNALESLLPQVEKDIIVLDGKYKKLDADIKMIDQEIDALEATQKEIRTTIDRRAEDKIVRIIEEQETMKAILDDQTKTQVSITLI